MRLIHTAEVGVGRDQHPEGRAEGGVKRKQRRPYQGLPGSPRGSCHRQCPVATDVFCRIVRAEPYRPVEVRTRPRFPPAAVQMRDAGPDHHQHVVLGLAFAAASSTAIPQSYSFPVWSSCIPQCADRRISRRALQRPTRQLHPDRSGRRQVQSAASPIALRCPSAQAA